MIDITNPQNSIQSVLIIGATGRTGVECIRHFADQERCHAIHAFCEDVSKLDSNDWDLCTSVIDGSARHAVDIEEALNETKTDWIILCVGSGDDTSPTNVRTFTAENVVRVLQKPEFLHVRVLAVSIAANSVGLVAKCRLRNVISDHKGQEAAIRSLGHRATIVRSTLFQSAVPEITVAMSAENSPRSSHKRSSSSDSESDSVGSSSSTKIASSIISSITKSPFRKQRSQSPFTSISVFDASKPAPSSQTSRSDLAQFIAEHVCQPRPRSELFDQLYVADRDIPRMFNVTSVPM